MNKNNAVFVGNIPYDATEEGLRDIFGQAGPIVQFQIVMDRETGSIKGFGFCEYRDSETALSAMRNLNNVQYNGRSLRVDWSNVEMRDGAATTFNAKLGQPALSGRRTAAAEGQSAEVPVQSEIVRAVYAIPMSQLVLILAAIQAQVHEDPLGARKMLVDDCSLAYALQTALHRLNAHQSPVQAVPPEEVKRSFFNVPLLGAAFGGRGGLTSGLAALAGLLKPAMPALARGV
jgi:cleavage stimulation factor subunit 2